MRTSYERGARQDEINYKPRIALFASQNQSVRAVVEFNLIERSAVVLRLRRDRVVGCRTRKTPDLSPYGGHRFAVLQDLNFCGIGRPAPLGLVTPRCELCRTHSHRIG